MCTQQSSRRTPVIERQRRYPLPWRPGSVHTQAQIEGGTLCNPVPPGCSSEFTTMSDVRSGEYKLAVQTDKTAHFAHAKVRIEPSTSDQFLVSAAGRNSEAWGVPALAGAERAIHELREHGYAEDPLRIDITYFMGTVMDTNDVDADMAAFMAVFTAFPEARQPILKFSAEKNVWVRS